MPAQFVDTPKNTTGNANRAYKPLSLAQKTQIINEDRERELGVLDEADAKWIRRKKLAQRIAKNHQLCLGQKEQALYFLFSTAYLKDGYAIAREYVKFCLNPKYMTRSTSWTGAENKRRVKSFED
jgi:hypothetical protein